METPTTTLLGYAISGLLHTRPRTGYDLRKVFDSTPMAHYSSSPGAIYPALKRLEERGLASSHLSDGSTSRPKRVYELTPLGVDMLRRWVSEPVTRDDIVWRMNELMLRFGFMGSLVERETTYRFLSQMVAETEAYVVELESFLTDMPRENPPHGRLALASGLEGYKAHARWASESMKEFTPASEKG